jgi:hypothetical protein
MRVMVIVVGPKLFAEPLAIGHLHLANGKREKWL